jgi:outer membrane lipoprotein-sorting protein
MTFEYLKNLKKYNQTIKLLNSDNFAMMVGFFNFVFSEKKNITIKHSEILNLLDDFVSDKNGYLKKYHGSEDEAIYELTPYTQKALEFIEGLEKSEFVGSRTKFNIIFELLEELMFETNLSDKERIKILQKQKQEIDIKIENIKSNKDLSLYQQHTQEKIKKRVAL